MSTPRHCTLLLALCLGASACTEEATPPSRGLLIQSSNTDRPYFHDFGVILDGSTPSHTFRLHNTEPNPVTLHDILASCSCAVPTVRVISPSGGVTLGSLHGKHAVCTIPPGATLEVEIAIDTSRIRRKNTDRLSTVRLRTDSAVTPFHTLELHVKVQQLIQATPWELKLGELPTSDGGTGHTDVINATQDPNVLLRTARSLSPDLSVTYAEETRLGRTVWVVKASLPPGLPLGPWEGAIELIVDAPDQDPPERTVRIPVRATIVHDIVLRPRRLFLLRNNPRGAEFTASALVPGTRITVASATLKGFPQGTFTTNAAPVRPDSQGRSSTWKITITPTGPLPEGVYNAQVQVTLADGTTLQSALIAR
jgi:hypothetical protein